MKVCKSWGIYIEDSKGAGTIRFLNKGVRFLSGDPEMYTSGKCVEIDDEVFEIFFNYLVEEHERVSKGR